MTARLLEADVCILTIVDHSTVHWWSVCDRGGFLPPSMTREARADSRETRFKEKPMVRRGLEFYAGAPLWRIKIGALSIRGAARQTFTAQEAELLKQMTEWAAGEVEVLLRKWENGINENLRCARDRLHGLERGRSWDEESGRAVLGQCLDIIRNTLRAKNVMILKINAAEDGPFYRGPCHITIGEEKFTDLCLACLDKPHSYALTMDPHPISLQLHVGRFVGQDVMRSASEVIWSYHRPVAVLVAFFEGVYRAVTHQEEQFTSEAAATLSTVWERVDTHESLAYIMDPTYGAHLLQHRLQSLNPSRPSTTSSTSFTSLLAPRSKPRTHPMDDLYAIPFIMIVEPITPHDVDVAVSVQSLTGLAVNSNAKGMEQALAVAMMRQGRKGGGVKGVPELEEMRFGGGREEVLRPRAKVELLADFSQMFDVLAMQHGITSVRKRGNLVMLLLLAVTGLEDDGKTCHDLINMVLDLSLTLAEYAKETGVQVQARIGIHGDEIPADCADDLEGVEAAWRALVNTCYHLETLSISTILVTETVRDHAEDQFRFLPRGTVFSRGIGACKVFSLVGSDDGTQELGVAAVEERARRAREAAEAALMPAISFGEVKTGRVKSKACSVM
ncbi:hypothetical protein BC829DRAFT_396175 [Chytridium lagenaria]|nr:hypothetical protein BC829DRAFT_396175 [Chytridium lagenaria]